MADSEHSTFGDFAKNQTKYGSTTKSIHTNEQFLKYSLQKDDTLQGIALKFGVSVSSYVVVNETFTVCRLLVNKLLFLPWSILS